jgi:SNW domain-containing protein 1
MTVGLVLPAPVHAEAPAEEEPAMAAPPAPTVRRAPPQGKRKGWIPRSQADFGGGGAFPEIHVAQYPLEMGRKGQKSSQVLALTTDASGKARHDVVASVGQRDGKVVHSSRDAITAKQLSEDELQKPSEEAAAENSERTRLALEAMVSGKAATAHGALDKAVADKKEPTYIR